MIRQLFTPWRMKYLLNAKEREVCIFCKAKESRDDREVGVLYRGRANLIMINRYPYSTGHLMIAPYQHLALPIDADRESLHELAELLKESLRILKEVYRPDGFNTGMNLGRVAGAGFADHYHMHIVPRWDGDTNFMTTVGETRLIPESLEQMYERLKPHFSRLNAERSDREDTHGDSAE